MIKQYKLPVLNLALFSKEDSVYHCELFIRIFK